MASDDADAGSSSAPIAPPSTDDASGYGLTLTILAAVLLALAYYGVVAIEGTHELGAAIPEPFYFLAFAFLFVVELLNSRQLGALGVARALAFTAIYGALFVFAVEGGAYLWENPEAALEGYVGVTVFAVALVLSALVYVGYLAVIEADRGGG